jgi:hypothetical protein
MVYEIKPRASHLNRMIDLEYRRSPTAQRSWMDYVRNYEPVAKADAPVLILSAGSTPLPDGFDVGSGFWCVSARAGDLMRDLFGSQVSFHEVPVTAKDGGPPLPSTNFVAFARFCELIDWQKSKVQRRRSPRLRPDSEIFALAGTYQAAVFKPMPKGQEMIWIERSARMGNRLLMSDYKVYATDGAAEAIGRAFPEVFILRKQREDDASTTA